MRPFFLLLPFLIQLISAFAAEPTRGVRGNTGRRRELTSAGATAANGAGSMPIVRWASAGGGWRAMVADMGYANAMQQAGLWDQPLVSAVSTTSGGSWFSTQFFYSTPFHNITRYSTPTQLASFVKVWMESYVQMQQSIPPSTNKNCQKAEWVETLFRNRLGNVNVTELCYIFQHYQGDWASFVEAMLSAASTAYGDSNFVNRTAIRSPGDPGTLPGLSGVDLLVQMSVAPVSKENNSTLHYLSPATPSNGVLAVALPAQYALKADGSASFHRAHWNGTEGTLTTSTGPAPSTFTTQSYEAFHLYPPNSQDTVLTQVSPVPTVNGTWPAPFHSAPTVTQLAASSSAAAGAFAGSVPSLLAQAISVLQAEIEVSDDKPIVKRFKLQLLQKQAETFYTNPLFANLAVCGSWPQPCHNSEGRLIDGAYTDGPSVAMNIGQYQTIDRGDRTRTLKLIVTDHKLVNETNVKLLSYFATNFTANVKPGEFLWQPSTGQDGLAEATPVLSPQIFSEYWDETTMSQQFRTLEGTNVTYAILKATTIDNPAFGVVSGQSVELLVLATNSNIPTLLVGTNLTRAYSAPLANLAESISSSASLVSLLRSFASDSVERL